MPVRNVPRPRLNRRTGVVAAAVGVLAVGGALLGAAGGSAAAPKIEAFALTTPELPVPADDGTAPQSAREVALASDGVETAPAKSKKAKTPAASSASTSEDAETLPSGAPTDAQVRAELEEAAGKGGAGKTSVNRLVSSATLTSDGLATIPADAPPKVQAIIQGGNAVAKKPYVYGGGHGRLAGSIWSDTAYDCSGSISYALAAAGLLKAPMTSGALADNFEPGEGKWVTIYGNAGHAFMYVAGLRFDTSGRSGDRGSRWQTAPRGTGGFKAVHPKGL